MSSTSNPLIKWRASWLKLPRFRRGGLLALLVSLGVIALYLIYSLLYLGQIYPRVSIGDHSFGGLTADQAKAKLGSLAARIETEPVRVVYRDQTIEFTPAEVEWRLDPLASIDRLFSFGRRQQWWLSAIEQLSAPFYRPRIQPVFSFNEASLADAISRFAQLHDQPAVSATAKIVNGRVEATPEATGWRLNQVDLKTSIVNTWATFSPTPLTVDAGTDDPLVILGDPTILQAQVDLLLNTELTLAWPGRQKRLKSAEISQLVGFVGEESSPGNSPSAAKLLTANFTIDSIKNYLQSIATETDRPAKEPKLVIRAGVLQIAAVAQPGSIVDRTASAAAILSSLTNPSSGQVVELTFKLDEPIIKEGNLAALGISELIGRGETSFAGSPVNRRANINHGVSILQSALIKPN
ncbi:MAG: peptidoglycan binding domain-containing protein [Patescibacteria group bacterium]